MNIYNSYFSSLLSKAWMEAMTAVNIVQGFKTTGIYPLDADAVIKKLPGTSAPAVERDAPPTFTPLKRQPHQELLSTPIIFNDDTRAHIDSPLQGPLEDNSLEQRFTMSDLLALKTPTFKVKDLEMKPRGLKKHKEDPKSKPSESVNAVLVYICVKKLHTYN